MLVYEQDVVLEACVQMWFQSELKHDRVVVAVDMRIHSVQPLEHLADESWEGLWKWHTWKITLAPRYVVGTYRTVPILLGNCCSLSMLA